jgi:hypothetical protein
MLELINKRSTGAWVLLIGILTNASLKIGPMNTRRTLML